MTETTFDREFVDGLSDTVTNRALERVAYSNFAELGVPMHTTEELEYAKKKSSYMLSKARPLMKIYKEADNEEFEEFMNIDENKNLKIIKKDIFKNIDFCINEDKWVMINKNDLPKIHFVIYNDKLKDAIKNFLIE